MFIYRLMSKKEIKTFLKSGLVERKGHEDAWFNGRFSRYCFFPETQNVNDKVIEASSATQALFGGEVLVKFKVLNEDVLSEDVKSYLDYWTNILDESSIELKEYFIKYSYSNKDLLFDSAYIYDFWQGVTIRDLRNHKIDIDELL